LAKVANAWSNLDRVDPEGEILLLRTMIERLSSDAKLAAALNIPTPIPASSSISTSTTTSVTAAVKEATATAAAAPTSPSKPPNPLRQDPVTATADDDDNTTTPTGTASRALSPSKHQHRRQQSELSGPKLVLAQNNPHLRSHCRRRQSAIVNTGMGTGMGGKEHVDERKMPGFVESGMEYQGVLADVLWGRWVEGLRGRWPLA